MNPNEARVALNTCVVILALVVLRLIAAWFTPITFDEAYYWMWSKHLAGGYYDHPPMVAVVIRLGTLIAGDTEFGVRLECDVHLHPDRGVVVTTPVQRDLTLLP